MTTNHNQTTAVGPVRGSQRIEAIDILRGFALLGVLTFNMIGFSGQSLRFDAWNEPLDQFVYIFTQFFVQAKFYSLFSFLFGWGMAMQMIRAEARGKNYLPRYVRRILLLLLFGAIHGILIWDGDILTDYALLGLVLILFRKRSDRFLLSSVLVCLLFSTVLTSPWLEGFRENYALFTEPFRMMIQGGQPVVSESYIGVTLDRLQSWLTSLVSLLYYFGNIFAMFLLGFYFGRKRIFEDIPAHIPFFKRLCAAGLLIGVPLNYVFTRSWVDPTWLSGPYGSMISVGARSFGAPALSMFYISGVVLLLQTRGGYARLQPLSYVGKMALSNYITHSVLFTLIFYGYGLGWYGSFGPFTGLLLTILTYLLQIRISKWWFDHYQFGPLEWIWRTLTYGRRQPLRLGVTYADLEAANLKLDTDTYRKRQRDLRVLAGTWLLLGLWAVGLVLWQSRIAQLGETTRALEVALRHIASSESGEMVIQGGEQSGDEQIPMPEMIPVAYQPGELAAAGDVLSIAAAFDAARAWEQISILAGPPYEGREAGSAQGWAAGDYLAGQMADLGFQPAGEDGTFFQTFPVYQLSIVEVPRLSITTPAGEVETGYMAGVDFAPVIGGYAGSGVGEGNAIWGNNCERSDFLNRDITGAVLLCREVPGVDAARNALEFGASALLLLPGENAVHVESAQARQETWLSLPLPVLRVSDRVANDLLSGSGYSLDDLSLNFDVLPLSTAVRVEVAGESGSACDGSPCSGRNIIAMLPGRDESYRNEIVVVGANIDAMGTMPGGDAYPGANSGASGVAVMLEMARRWQEEGFLPLRTVVFVIWDGSVQEQAGLAYFLESPLFPLDNIARYVHIGAVGSAYPVSYETGEFEGQVLASAGALNLALGEASEGIPELEPFQSLGIPVLGLEAYDESGRVPRAGETDDSADWIDRERLSDHGSLAMSLIMIVAESEPAIDRLLQLRAQAVEEGDVEGFLQRVDLDARAIERSWLDDALALDPVTASFTSSEIIFDGTGASGLVEATVEYFDEEDELESYTVHQRIRFSRLASGWTWTGPDLFPLVEDDGTTFHVLAPGSLGEEAVELLHALEDDYAALARSLGFSQTPDIDVLIFQNTSELRASVGYAFPRGESLRVEPGLVRIAYQEDLHDSTDWQHMLVGIALAEAGIDTQAFAWLEEGLTQYLLGEQNPLVWQPALLNATRETLQEEGEEENTVDGWGSVVYLRERFGMPGLGSILRALGRACDQGACVDAAGAEEALTRSAGMGLSDLQADTQAYWATRLDETDTQIDALLIERVQAILSGERSAFLSTVDTRVPALIYEEGAWFDALTAHQLDHFNLSGELMAFLPDGSIAVRVVLEYGLADVDEQLGTASVPLTIRMRPSAGNLLWSGMPYELLRQGAIRVLYPSGAEDAARNIAALAEEQLDIISAELGLSHGMMTIKLMSDAGRLRIAVDPGAPEMEGGAAWATGQSILLSLQGGTLAEDVETELGHALLRTVLQQAGVDSEWLVQAATVFLSSELDSRRSEHLAMQNLSAAARAVRSQNLPSLVDLARLDRLSSEERGVSLAHAWSSMAFLLEEADHMDLRTLVSIMRGGMSLEAFIERQTDMDMTQFETTWGESLAAGFTDPDWMEMVSLFDPEEALDHIANLTSSDMTGRRIGSAGAEAAAAYIAAQFAEAGLLPADEVLATSPAGTAEASMDNGAVNDPSSYYQFFPVEMAELQTAPALSILSEDGEVLHALEYREDFRMLPILLEEERNVTAEMVWVLSEDYSGLELGGRIVLRAPVFAPSVEIAMAEAHGAGGLILVGESENASATLAKTVLTADSMLLASFPVFEIQNEAFEVILASAGLTPISVYQTPPALRLGLWASLAVNQHPALEELVPNVLGVLPGSDPSLQDEIVILGAHYDHVGDDPPALVCETGEDGESVCVEEPGLRYPGANDNASGIGVLLEIARVWHEAGYQPARTVVFAAWNGQESGQLGSTFYVEHPVFPIEDTVAVIQLDAVGGGEGYYLEVTGLIDQDGYLLYIMQAADDIVDGRLHLNYETEGAGSTRVRPEAFFSVTGRQGLTELSDHLPFRDAGIPALMVRWRGADERNLPEQMADEVNPDWLNYTGRMVSMAAMMLAR